MRLEVQASFDAMKLSLEATEKNIDTQTQQASRKLDDRLNAAVASIEGQGKQHDDKLDAVKDEVVNAL